MAHATVDDYQKYTGTTVDDADRITRLLASASRVIDWTVKTAFFDPDSTEVADALRDATCAQAAWFEETGDATGASTVFAGGSLGSLSLNGAAAAGGQSAVHQRLAPDALLILANADLIQSKVAH